MKILVFVKKSFVCKTEIWWWQMTSRENSLRKELRRFVSNTIWKRKITAKERCALAPVMFIVLVQQPNQNELSPCNSSMTLREFSHGRLYFTSQHLWRLLPFWRFFQEPCKPQKFLSVFSTFFDPRFVKRFSTCQKWLGEPSNISDVALNVTTNTGHPTFRNTDPTLQLPVIIGESEMIATCCCT